MTKLSPIRESSIMCVCVCVCVYQGGGVVPPLAVAPITATAVAQWQSRLDPRRSDTLPVKTLLDAVTRSYSSGRTPPTSSAFVTPLRYYQKQSLALMIDTEESQVEWMNRLVHDDFATRGGWLCSDVSMGKTNVVVALVVTKPIQEYLLSTQVGGRVRLKATVVMTSISLMGQWVDEMSKHAPNLKVTRFHPSSSAKRRPIWNDIQIADLTITSATYTGDQWNLCSVDLSRILFHRVVMDSIVVGQKCNKPRDYGDNGTLQL